MNRPLPARPARLLDLAPTILESLGCPIPGDRSWKGVRLLP